MALLPRCSSLCFGRHAFFLGAFLSFTLALALPVMAAAVTPADYPDPTPKVDGPPPLPAKSLKDMAALGLVTPVPGDHWCTDGDNMTDAQVQAIKDKVEAFKAAQRPGRKLLGAPAWEIPVHIHNVFFVDADGTQTGYITYAQCKQQIDVLNQAYGATMLAPNPASIPDDGTLRSALPFHFYLAGAWDIPVKSWDHFSFDPSSSTSTSLRTRSHKGNCQTLNMWVHAPPAGSTLLGQSKFAWTCFPGLANPEDGMFIHFGSFPGGHLTPYNLGLTAAHETGHWLGLWHTFQGGCASSLGDAITDTPTEGSPYYDCGASRDSCAGGGKDPIRNIMDYPPDKCMWKFTPGQANWAQWTFKLFRT